MTRNCLIKLAELEKKASKGIFLFRWKIRKEVSNTLSNPGAIHVFFAQLLLFYLENVFCLKAKKTESKMKIRTLFPFPPTLRSFTAMMDFTKLDIKTKHGCRDLKSPDANLCYQKKV